MILANTVFVLRTCWSHSVSSVAILSPSPHSTNTLFVVIDWKKNSWHDCFISLLLCRISSPVRGTVCLVVHSRTSEVLHPAVGQKQPRFWEIFLLNCLIGTSFATSHHCCRHHSEVWGEKRPGSRAAQTQGLNLQLKGKKKNHNAGPGHTQQQRLPHTTYRHQHPAPPTAALRKSAIARARNYRGGLAGDPGLPTARLSRR